MRFIGKFAAALGLLALFVVGMFWVLGYAVQKKLSGPDPVTIATASLQGLREQNSLSAFAARFVSVTTSTQSQFGLSAKKTLIMPGMVRYEVDLGKLEQKDVAWDAASKTLSVTLPPVEVDQPQIDLNQVKEYGDGGILTSFTDAEAKMDVANRRAGQNELIRQAHEGPMINMARNATRNAVARSFVMPLKAAGIDATVAIRFADEPSDTTARWDTSRTITEVLGNGN